MEGSILANKCAVVIGGAMGIGHAIVQQFLQHDYEVIVTDIHPGLEGIYAQTVHVKTFQFDVANPVEVEQFAQELRACVTRVDAFVYAVGITRKLSFLEVDYELWKKTTDINVTGLFYVMKYIHPLLLASPNVSLTFIGSGSAMTGSGGGVQYYSTKGGMVGLMRYYVHYYASIQARVNVIAPRVIQSQMLEHLYPTEESRKQLVTKIPVGRIGESIDIASLVIYLSSEEGSYMNGQVLLLDGGRTYANK